MYAILYKGYPILQPEDNNKFPVISATLQLEVNDAGTLTVKVPNTHPSLEKIEMLTEDFKVFKNRKLIFKGHMIKEPQSFEKMSTLEIEGKLASFSDSIKRPYNFSGKPEDLFKELTEGHNKQADPSRQFKVGEITAKDKNDYIHLSSEDYSTTMDVLKKLRNSIGGYMHIRYEEDGDYIDWLADYPYTNVQKIEFAKNLLDLTHEVSAEETYSACIPLGKKDEETKKYVTVESVNQGSDVIYNQSLVSKIGRRFAPPDIVTWENVTRPENLKTKAENWLNNQGVMLNETLSLNAIDLHYADKSIESFDFGKYIHVISKPHNLEKLYLLSKIDIDILHPENTVIQLGEKKKTLYDSLQGKDGKDGVGLSKTVVEYANSDDGSKPPETGFSETFKKEPGKYLWTKTTWIYTDGTKATSYTVVKDGDSADAKGIKSVSFEYAYSDSMTECPSSGWKER